MKRRARFLPPHAPASSLSTPAYAAWTRLLASSPGLSVRPRLTAVAAAQEGVFLRRQALTCGYSSDEVKLALRRREWVRVRHGAYAEASGYDDLTEAERYRMLVLAVMLAIDEPAVASHNSAAAVLGLPLWGTDLSMVHVTRRLGYGARTQAAVKHHTAGLPDHAVTRARSLAVTCPERTSIDLAREYGFEAGVVAADAALRGGADLALLQQMMKEMREWPGACAAAAAVAAADGCSESPGESLARLVVVESGLPPPRLQARIVDGDFCARVDMLVERWNLVVEFDGRGKYERRGGRDESRLADGDVVWAEKLREDRLRDLGFEVVRLVWADLAGCRRVLAIQRLLDAAARGRRRSARCGQYLAA